MQHRRSLGLSETASSLRSYVDLNFTALVVVAAAAFAAVRTFGLREAPGTAFPGWDAAIGSFAARSVESLGITVSGSLQARVFVAHFLGLALPGVGFSCACQMFFHSLHMNVRRSLTSLMIGLYVVCSLVAVTLTNRVWAQDGVLAHLPLRMEALFLGLRALLVTAAVAGIAVRFVGLAQSRVSRGFRIFLVVTAVGGVLFLDWRTTKKQRFIAQENLQPKHAPTFILMLPDITSEAFDELLARRELEPWKERLAAKGRTFPASASVLPQATTLLTGTPPYAHGVRTNFPELFLLRELSGAVQSRFTSAGNALHAAVPGTLEPVSKLFADGVPGSRCHPSLEQAFDVDALERSLLPYALLPELISHALFPEYDCSQKFMSLAQHVRLELSEMAALLKKPVHLTSIFWLAPNPHASLHGLGEDEEAASTASPTGVTGKTNEKDRNGPTSELQDGVATPLKQRDLERARVRMFAQSIEVFDEYLRLVGLLDSSTVALIGLPKGAARTGSFAIYGAHAAQALRTWSQAKPTVPQTDLLPLIAGTDAGRALAEPRTEAQPLPLQEWGVIDAIDDGGRRVHLSVTGQLQNRAMPGLGRHWIALSSQAQEISAAFATRMAHCSYAGPDKETKTIRGVFAPARAVPRPLEIRLEAADETALPGGAPLRSDEATCERAILDTLNASLREDATLVLNRLEAVAPALGRRAPLPDDSLSERDAQP